MDYATFKFRFSAAFALLGGCIALVGFLTAAAPGELHQIATWLFLLGFVLFSAFMYGILRLVQPPAHGAGHEHEARGGHWWADLDFWSNGP